MAKWKLECRDTAGYEPYPSLTEEFGSEQAARAAAREQHERQKALGQNVHIFILRPDGTKYRYLGLW